VWSYAATTERGLADGGRLARFTGERVPGDRDGLAQRKPKGTVLSTACWVRLRAWPTPSLERWRRERRSKQGEQCCKRNWQPGELIALPHKTTAHVRRRDRPGGPGERLVTLPASRDARSPGTSAER